jgi:hypothetical protein
MNKKKFVSNLWVWLPLKPQKTYPTIFLEGKTTKKEKIIKIIDSTHLHKVVTSCSNICKTYAYFGKQEMKKKHINYLLSP